jgi:uncharacterized protein (TIGR03437 family)
MRQSSLVLLFYLFTLPLPLLLAQFSTGSGEATGAVTLSGSVSPRIRPEDDRGPVEIGRKLSQLTLVFKRTPEQRAALDRFLKELQDPSSPNFHKWLTPEEFGERFGASTESVNRVGEWLRSEGFVVSSTSRGRGWIVFSGTVAQVQKSFHTEIHRYEVGGKAHYGPALPPSIPAELAGLVAGIRGLDDFFLEATRHPLPLTTESDGSHALAPGDIDTIYSLVPPTYGGIAAPPPAGMGLTIAVVGASQVDLSDIQQFRKMFQLPANDPTLVLAGDDPGTVSTAMLEADSDIEWAGGVAAGASIVYAYATDVLVATQYAIDQNLAPILSMSFSECEANISPDDATVFRGLAQQANAQGITWVAASGDAGAAACDQGSKVATQGLAVSFPASIPEVTAVGGTEFNEASGFWSPVNATNLSSADGYLPEIAWNDTSTTLGLEASGGGVSVLFNKPAWQAGPGVPNDGMRDLPDIALDASPNHDPYIVVSGGQTYSAGGTSLATPVFAGILAIVEHELAGPGVGPGFGNFNPTLYASAAGSNPVGLAFHDITSGNNIVPCTGGTPDCTSGSLGYSAGPGYDLVTGLGSINGTLLQYTQLATLTTVNTSATQVPEGTPLTFTATVQAYNRAVPTGNVQFEDGGSLQQFGESGNPVVLDQTGRASATATLSAGTHSITASYFSACCHLADSVSAALNVVVTPAAPHAPVLAAPLGDATNVSASVALSWSSVPFATSYDVYFGTSPSPPFWGNVAGLQCVPGALATNTKYYWMVAARNGSGATASPVSSFTTAAVTYVISTVAGSSAAGYSPNGTPATQALLSGPTDVAFDRNGNLYVADAGNNVVRKIGSDGTISTVAGGGTGGDGGPATSAALSGPTGIVLDAQGNLYISEPFTTYGLSNVRKVSPAGIITTIAGGKRQGYSGDGGPAINAQLSKPEGLAVDSAGNLFIADSGNGCIREISAGIISDVAGTCGDITTPFGTSIGDGGPATSGILLDPQSVAVDSAGNLFIADSSNCRIRKVTHGIITTVAGDTGTAAGCSQNSVISPQWITVDPHGNIYISSGFYIETETIIKFSNGVSTTIAGGGYAIPGDGGPGTSASIFIAGGLAVDSAGRVYFAESSDAYPGQPSSQTIRLLTPSSNFTPPLTSIAPGGVVNAATFASSVMAPGSIATLYGNFGFASPAQASGVPLPTSLTGLSVQFQSGNLTIDAPLFYASPQQINLQIPWELAGQSSANIQPFLNGTAGATYSLALTSFSPGIFVTGSFPFQFPAIVNSSGQLVGTATAGEVLEIYCTGLGPVTNQPTTGSAASSTILSETVTTPTVTIGGVGAKVLFSGLAPGTVGEYQVDIQVPSGITPGPEPLVLSIGGVPANTATITVQ